MGQKEPLGFGSWQERKVGQKEPPRLSTQQYDLLRHTETRQYDLWQPNVGQKRATKIRQYVWVRVGQKEPPRLGSSICYGQTWAERATETREYDLLRPYVSQKEPPRLGSTICYGQELARKSHQDSAVRIVTKRGPDRATETRQYDLLRSKVGQKEPPRLGSATCSGQEFRRPRVPQYDVLRVNVCQKEPPRLGSTICSCQQLARKSHEDSVVRFVTAKRWPEKVTETQQYDL